MALTNLQTNQSDNETLEEIIEKLEKAKEEVFYCNERQLPDDFRGLRIKLKNQKIILISQYRLQEEEMIDKEEALRQLREMLDDYVEFDNIELY